MAATACKASCTLISEAGTHTVVGHITFSQADGSSPTTLTGTLSGLTPGKHGISVSVWGDVSQGAASCGPIFNPFGE